jgi:hypothetical protein
MTTASPATFTSLSDNMASQAAFYAKFISKTDITGIKGYADSLLTHILSAEQVPGIDFTRRILNASEQLTRSVDIDGVMADRMFQQMLAAMNRHFDTIITFAQANGVQVAPEFKTVADIFLGISVPKDAVFAPETILGQFINPTGYTQQDSIDASLYPDADLVLEADTDLGGSAATYAVTVEDGLGTPAVVSMSVDAFVGQGTQFPIGAPGQFSSVSSIVITSGGTPGDSLTAKSLRLRPLPFIP